MYALICTRIFEYDMFIFTTFSFPLPFPSPSPYPSPIQLFWNEFFLFSSTSLFHCKATMSVALKRWTPSFIVTILVVSLLIKEKLRQIMLECVAQRIFVYKESVLFIFILQLRSHMRSHISQPTILGALRGKRLKMCDRRVFPIQL